MIGVDLFCIKHTIPVVCLTGVNMVVPVGTVMPFRMHLKGQRFGNWVVVGEPQKREGRRSLEWPCKCDCGTDRYVDAQSLRDGKSKSCGCEKAALIQNGRVYQRRAGWTPEYRAWRQMRWRCSPYSKEKAKLYADRGITICAAWQSFDQFLKDMGLVPHPGWTLDRIDNDLGYYAGNCRWYDCQVQAQNRRQNQGGRLKAA